MAEVSDNEPLCMDENCSNWTFPEMSINSSVYIIQNETPKGYSVPHIILTSILISVIMFVIVFGNLLVVIAIFTDRNLKTTQNWFIASLAVADFLLGLVIMPFSLANEMMGYWYFGRVWCDLWKAIDVLLCTASILSICLISLDRYWSITRAVQYSRQRTGKRAALMIAFVWFLSAIICVPPLIGWKNPLPVSDYPMCLLSDEIGYVIYSTMGSFYIPCVIMVFVYFKIYLAARRLARKNVKNKQVRVQMKVEIKNEITSEYKTEKMNNAFGNSSNKHNNTPIISDDPFSKPDSAIELSSESIPESQQIPRNGEEAEQDCTSLLPSKLDCIDSDHIHTNTDNTTISITESGNDSKPNVLHCNQNCSGKKSEVNTFIQKLSKKKQRANGNKTSKGWRTASLREHERQKKKIAKARERRATIVLGLVMAAFILCWFPFFTLYIITSFCYCIGEVVFTVVFWAGYCNSALNPIIYTVFNREFRHAFHKIICRKSLRCR